MTAVTMKMTYQDSMKKTAVPATARGRALYTVDWFLNGMPDIVDPDNPQSRVQDAYGNGQYES